MALNTKMISLDDFLQHAFSFKLIEVIYKNVSNILLISVKTKSLHQPALRIALHPLAYYKEK